MEKSNGGGGRVLAEEESLGFPVCNLDKAVKCPGMTAKSVRRVLNMTASLPAISSTHRRLHRLPRNTHVYTHPGLGADQGGSHGVIRVMPDCIWDSTHCGF